MYLIGFDVGGTKIEASLIELFQPSKFQSEWLKVQRKSGNTDALRVVTSKRAPTERKLGYEHIIKTLSELAKAICLEAKIPLVDVVGIGLAVPGSVEPKSQQMVNGNTMALMNKDLTGDLKNNLGFSKLIAVANDANCFALAEALCGAGVQHGAKTKTPLSQQTCLGIILGTGTGGGAIIGGKMLVGHRGGAAEFGHTTLKWNGHPCYCGRSGCAEQYLCGPALEAAFNNRRYAQVSGFPTAAEIFELNAALDPVAVAVVKQYRQDLAQFLGNLVSVFDPNFIVLGGGVSRQPAIYEGLEDLIAERTFISSPKVPVYQYAISDSAGAIGAGLHLLNCLEDPQ